MTAKEFRNQYLSLPEEAGIYKFIGKEETVLYVGKARNLRNRLSSYFTGQASYKTATMLRHALAIEYTIVQTEQDALLLENQLIKTLQPRYNIFLKDDKTYPWICIRHEPFPRVFLTRRMQADQSEYFGPYTSVGKVQSILDFIRKVYPLRTCSLNLTDSNIKKKKFKVCLEYHLGNCKGPCEARQTAAGYEGSISQIRGILKGKLIEVKRDMKSQMQALADQFNFEAANEWKKKIEFLNDYQHRSVVVHSSITDTDVFSFHEEEKAVFVSCLRVVNGMIIQTQTVELVKKIEEANEDLLRFGILEIRKRLQSSSLKIIVPFKVELPYPAVAITIPTKGDPKKLLELSEKNLKYYLLALRKDQIGKKKESPDLRILRQLKEDFHLKELPIHIECFDNSNFHGDMPVASLVVFKNGRPSKKDYRHFNIKTVKGPNDFASMEEIVYRRYKRLINEKQSLPQLILIDGGKGQLSAALNSIEKLNLYGKVAIAGIAKRLEEIYFPNDPLPLYIDKKSSSLRLVQHIRNEAHRFAITFHRSKRSKEAIHSELLDIKGISEKTADKLLKEFRSVDKVRLSTEEELASIIGRSKAKKIVSYFSLTTGK